MAKQEKKQNDGAALLRADLKNGSIKRAYIFHGEETYLRDYYLEQLRKRLIDGPAEAFNYHRFDEKAFSIQALSDAVNALPVMSERSMIRVDDLDLGALNEEGREGLIAILEDLPDYVCLVLYYDIREYKLDRRQKKLCAAVEKNCTELSFPKQSQASLTEWCIRHFRSAGKTISPDLCGYLIFSVGGTMAALGPEIEKISAYATQEQITKQDIDAVTIPVLDAQVFDITDALSSKNFGGALSKLNTIFQMQQEPIPVLGAISSNLRRLYAAKVLSSAGKGSDELMKLCGLGDYPARKTMSAARGFSLEWCKKAVVLCAETDYQMKTSYDDPKRLVELLLLELSQEAER